MWIQAWRSDSTPDSPSIRATWGRCQFSKASSWFLEPFKNNKTHLKIKVNSLIKSVCLHFWDIWTQVQANGEPQPAHSHSGLESWVKDGYGSYLQRIPSLLQVFGVDIEIWSCKNVCSAAQRQQVRFKCQRQTQALRIIRESGLDMLPHTFNPR